MTRVLVAGVVNIFLGDDGFGSAVAQQLAAEPLPDEVKVVDFGISAVHLAYELLESYDAVILVDATPQGGEPGTLYVIEPETRQSTSDASESLPPIDPHALTPDWVLVATQAVQRQRTRILVVGCEPATLDDGIGLSPPVQAAVSEAARLVRSLVAEALAQAPS
jgi:hydrogenase maturation protease